MNTTSLDFLAKLNNDDLVDEITACHLIGGSTAPIHRSTFRRGIRAGRFPGPLKIGGGTSRWRVGELREVHATAAAERDQAAV